MANPMPFLDWAADIRTQSMQREIQALKEQLARANPETNLFDRYQVGTLFQKKANGTIVAMTPDGQTHRASAPDEPFDGIRSEEKKGDSLARDE